MKFWSQQISWPTQKYFALRKMLTLLRNIFTHINPSNPRKTSTHVPTQLPNPCNPRTQATPELLLPKYPRNSQTYVTHVTMQLPNPCNPRNHRTHAI